MATARNTYATLAVMKEYAMPAAASDTDDDNVLIDLLNEASRAIDAYTGQHFYPQVMAREYRVGPDTDGRTLYLDKPFVSLTSVVNGDGTTVTSTQYITQPYNDTPYYALKLASTSGVVWQATSDPDTDTIVVTGITALHLDYANAWLSASTLSAGVNAAVTTWPVASGTAYEIGQIVKADSELALITGISTNDLTVTRAWNGSTAAAHDSAAAVTVWQVYPPIELACKIVVQDGYLKRTKAEAEGDQVTGAGVVIRSAQFPKRALELLHPYKERW